MLKLAAFVGVVLFAGPAFAAGATETELLGKDPGTAAAYSCFSRHYDDDHLASHPKQNVVNMQVFVESTYDKTDDVKRSNYLEIGVNFRKIGKPFEISGGCQTSVDGKKTLNCGGDCDGGHFDISTRGSDSILVSIPDAVRVWDPDQNDPNVDLPKGAEFGQDDKLFKLDRVDVKQCESLMDDDAKTAIVGSAEPVK